METMNEMLKASETITKDMQKSIDEYIELGIKAQDEMFKMATNQMNSLKEYTEFALRTQSEMMSQLEKTAKHNRQVWLDGLKQLRESVEENTKKATASLSK